MISTQKVDSVEVNWQFYLDDAKQFQFEKIRILVLQRANQDSAWEKVGSFTPNQTGLLRVSVPKGSWMQLEVSTFDPTISHHTWSFYSLEETESVSIYMREFYIDKSAPQTLEQKINLKRSAAFTLCVPERITSGCVFIENLSNKSPIHIIKFFTREALTEPDIGGLTPGRYLVTILYYKANKETSKKISL
jgi:hypothetical protein